MVSIGTQVSSLVELKNNLLTGKTEKIERNKIENICFRKAA